MYARASRRRFGGNHMRIMLALAFVTISSLAHADNRPRTVRVVATATSSLDKFPPWMAIGTVHGNTNGWCANKGDGVGEAITYTFDEPVSLARIELAVDPADDINHTGEHDRAAPSRVEIKTDTQTVEAKLRAF